MSILRLQVFLSRNGVSSRRRAFVLIQEGRVAVNGQVNREPSTPIDPVKDDVMVDGKRIEAKVFNYVMLNKPKGYVTTRFDRFADKTVYDLLPKEYQHLVPVGRLDKDTEGLLLLTNDGDLVYRLTHPKHNIDKIYFVRLDGILNDLQKKQIEQGVVLEGKKTAPAKIHNMAVIASDRRERSNLNDCFVANAPRNDNRTQTELKITIHEGRKRQVRLMFGKVGLKVVYLQRVSQGPLLLEKLSLGQIRPLTENEVVQLKKI